MTEVPPTPEPAPAPVTEQSWPPPAPVPPGSQPARTATEPQQPGFPAQQQPAYPPPPGYQQPPPYSWAPGPAYPPVASPPGVDGFAITALIFSIIGGVLFAVGFAIAALRRIGRGERRGKPLAIIALCLSAAWVVALVGLFGYQAGRSPHRSTAGAVTRAGQVSPAELRAGDCVEMPRVLSGVVKSMPIMPCSQPHNGQVIAQLNASDASFPGESELEGEGLAQCRVAARDYLGGTSTLLHIVVFVPTSTRWSLGDRKESCVLVDVEKDITGDVRADG